MKNSKKNNIRFVFRNHWITNYNYETFIIKLTRYKITEPDYQCISIGLFNFELAIKFGPYERK